MIYISDRQQREYDLLTMEDCIGAITEMFHLMYQKDYVMAGKNGNSHGSRMIVPKQDGNNLYIAMSGYLGGKYNTTVCKFHGPNRYIDGCENETNHVVILSDGDTGIPKAILQGNYLTTMRTAAVSAYATINLATDKPIELGIVGPGKINTEYVKWAINYYPSIKKLKIKGRGEEGIKKFKSNIKKCLKRNIEIEAYDSLELVVRESDIISVNTGFDFKSVADMPFIREAWIKDTALIICPAFIKFSNNLIQKNANLIVDNYKMYESYVDELGKPTYFKLSNLGNLFVDMVDCGKIDREQIKDIFDVVCGNKKLAIQKPTIFASGGMGIEDIAVGCTVLEKAVEKNVGTKLEF